ncbi:MAG: MBL fold metallo-hydrolase, partial [Dehalococcoidia bacterium]|nr:MBL fold metallo-hydrolase [Dehalococcoidia bacterium]
MKIAVVYDNKTLDPDLSPAWGFSCLVGDDLLFDTGGDGPRLLSNMEQMGLDVGRIKTVVLSHAHGDHTGGLGNILAVNKEVTVYLPRSFPSRFKEQVRAHARVVEVHEPMEIAEGIYTTGEM